MKIVNYSLLSFYGVALIALHACGDKQSPPTPPSPVIGQRVETPASSRFLKLAQATDKHIDVALRQLENKPAFARVVGLQNCGNTCYMNALLQSLLHSNLGRYTEVPFDQIHFAQGKDRNKSLFKRFYDVASAYRKASANSVVSPDGIVDFLLDIGLTPGAQEDADEFLNKFLEHLSAELNVLDSEKPLKYDATDAERANFLFAYDWIKAGRYGAYSIVNDLFNGIFKTTFTRNDGSVGANYAPFTSIALPLAQSTETVPLEQLLAEFSQGSIKTTIHKAPKTLIIALKRFDNAGHKITTKTAYPASLSLTTPVDGAIRYALFAVVLHSGTLTGGHYTAQVKTANNEWHLANDSRVTTSSEATALSQNEAAYVLFYKRI